MTKRFNMDSESQKIDDLELEQWLQASADDTWDQLGEMSKEEYEYYMKLSKH